MPIQSVSQGSYADSPLGYICHFYAPILLPSNISDPVYVLRAFLFLPATARQLPELSSLDKAMNGKPSGGPANILFVLTDDQGYGD